MQKEAILSTAKQSLEAEMGKFTEENGWITYQALIQKVHCRMAFKF